MSWLSDYTYRKKSTVVATAAGAQTNYQLELKVGESSGAAGEDVDCENHCICFPNDIRFTKEDGKTKHDYWIKKIEGTIPNRTATVIIEVASIPASGSVDFYVYYGYGDTGYEDFTTFTEVDVGADRIQKTANHIDHRAERDETTYLYKNYGTGFFTNFTHKIKVKAASGENNGAGQIWMLANDLGNIKALNDASKRFVFINLHYDSSTLLVKLEEGYGGAWNTDTNSGGFGFGDWIYIKIVKGGTDIKAYLYSDADYSTLVDTLNITLHADHTFKYLYGCNTYNDSANYYIENDIENFNIGVEDESNGEDTFEFFDDFLFPETFQFAKTTKDNVHLSSDYCMDPNICLLHDGTWFMVFREGSIHLVDLNGKIRFVKSTDKGSSWSSPSTIYDTANKDDRQPNVFEFQEGSVWTIMVAWTVTGGSQGGIPDDACEKVQVIKSTNGGSSWSSPVTVTAGDDMRATSNPIQMANDNILIPLTSYVTGKKRCKVAISDDDGVSWTIYNATDHYDDSRCNEISIVEYQDGKLLGICRNQAQSYFNKITSTDYGLNWSSPVLTNIPSPKDRPHLIQLESGDIALTYAHTDDDYRIIRSSDNGVTWGVNNYCSVYYEVGLSGHGGYPASIEYAPNKVFTIFEKQISTSDEDIFGNEINIVDIKWSIAGAVSLSDGVVHLDNDDGITGKTAFGNGHCYESLAKANEQDIVFIAAVETHNIWNDDAIMLGNSDLHANDFDRFFSDFWKAGSQDTVSIDNWNDFRTTYYQYRIKKISNSEVITEQEAHSNTYTDSAHIPTMDLKIVCRVWDSSQESTLDVDWAFVRKCVSPEPTWGSWGNEGTLKLRSYGYIFG